MGSRAIDSRNADTVFNLFIYIPHFFIFNNSVRRPAEERGAHVKCRAANAEDILPTKCALVNRRKKVKNPKMGRAGIY